MNQHVTLSILLFLELLIYMERGVIPGSSSTIIQFINTALETTEPSFYLGLLQSSFVGGLSVASLVFAHSTHYLPYSFLIITGLVLWIVAMFMSGSALYLPRYQFTLLLVGRILSGVGEASLVSLAPPLILRKVKGAQIGFWMGLFCAVIPIGTALGFAFGGFITEFTTWNISFYALAAVMVPCVVFITFYARYIDDSKTEDAETTSTLSSPSYQHIVESPSALNQLENMKPQQHTTNTNILSKTTQMEPDSISSHTTLPDKQSNLHGTDRYMMLEDDYRGESKNGDGLALDGQGKGSYILGKPPQLESSTVNEEKKAKTWLSNLSFEHVITDISALLQSFEFLSLCIASAAYSAVTSIFSTFGIVFLLDLELVSSKLQASFLMGLVAAGSGLLGGLAGGALSALSTRHYNTETDEDKKDVSVGSSNNPEHTAGSTIVCNDKSQTQTESLEKHISPNAGAVGNPMDTNNHVLQIPSQKGASPTAASFVDMPLAAFKEKYETITAKYKAFVQMQALILHLIPVICIGAVCLIATAFAYNTAVFLLLLSLGLFAVFLSQSNINIAIMLAVPQPQQGFAIAASMLFLHVLGDVPAPPIAGYVKDVLAPSCSTLDTLTETVTNECKQQAFYVRLTMLISTLWILWMVAAIIAAYLFARRTIRRVKEQQNALDAIHVH